MSHIIFKSKSDEELIELVSYQNEEALEELYNRYNSRLKSLIYRYSGSVEDTEEIYQSVFYNIWKYSSSFKPGSNFSPWAYKIAVNQCIHFKKRQNILKRIIDKSYDIYSAVFSTIIVKNSQNQSDSDNRRIELLKTAVNSLPKRQKMALVLCKFEKFSQKEAADTMEVSESSLESLLFRAKKNLKDIMNGD